MQDDLTNYKIYVDIFKGYLDTALTANIWFYALTGAVVSYFLTHQAESPLLRISLILPAVLGGMLAWISYKGIAQAQMLDSNAYSHLRNIQQQGLNSNSEEQAQGNEQETKVGDEAAPPAKILKEFLIFTAGVNALVCVGLVALFLLSFFPSFFPGCAPVLKP